MKLSVVDAELEVRRKVVSIGLAESYTFDTVSLEDASALGYGDLAKQDQPFFLFTSEVLNSRRVGPSRVSPTRYYADLLIEYRTKTPQTLSDLRKMESVANHFAEQQLAGVRFRTYTPMPHRKSEGFTVYSGIIDFDFEIYRGG